MQGNSDVRVIAQAFLRLSVTTFGGPAAHVAMMQDEFVRQRQWLSQERFQSLVAATHLIPGPNSTELAMHIGYLRAGWVGFWVAGISFILPASALVALTAWLYQSLGHLSWIEYAFSGMRPMIVAVVAHAFWVFARGTVKTAWDLELAAGCVFLLAFKLSEIQVIAITGLLGWLSYAGRKLLRSRSMVLLLGGGLGLLSSPLRASSAAEVTLAGLLGIFAKIGAVLFGSGYVLVAFLRSELVEARHWLSEGMLLDAIAVGQMTPGPVFTTATFIGWMLSGPWGASVATIGIFLPAFVFVAMSIPLLDRLAASKAFAAALHGVVVASAVLIGATLLALIQGVGGDFVQIGMAVLGVGVMAMQRGAATWLLGFGAVVGLVRGSLGI